MSENTAIQTVEKIYQALRAGEARSIRRVAKEAELSWRTTKRYLELIMDVQNRPPLIIQKTGEGPRYKRKNMAGRPTKK